MYSKGKKSRVSSSFPPESPNTVGLQNIDFNAADTAMAAALESLPNIGTVLVTRTGPDGQLGYSWYVTFSENPGSFPAGSGDVALLSPDASGLEGDGAWCRSEEESAGTSELSGAFVLAFTSNAESGGVTHYTDELPYNSLPEEVRGKPFPTRDSMASWYLGFN